MITEKRVCVRIVNAAPPDIPDLENIETVDHKPEPVPSGKQASPWDATPVCEGTEGMGQVTIIYGVVKYRDAFAEGHATTFGYRLTPDNQLTRLEGWPKYNENT